MRHSKDGFLQWHIHDTKIFSVISKDEFYIPVVKFKGSRLGAEARGNFSWASRYIFNRSSSVSVEQTQRYRGISYILAIFTQLTNFTHLEKYYKLDFSISFPREN